MGRTKITFPKKKTVDAPVPPEDAEAEPVEAAVVAPIAETGAKTVGKQPRKRRRVKQGVKALREIKKYQTSTEPVLLKAPFQRLCRELSQQFHTEGLRFQKSAMAALQIGAEEYLVDLYSDAYKHVTLNTRRKTLSKKDMKTVLALRRREGASNSSAPISY